MKYEIHLHPKADKEIAKLSKQTRKEILETHFPKIVSDPYLAGKGLSGKLKGFKKYTFSSRGVSYRIIYEIWEKENIVLIIMVGPRENIYLRLLRRLGV